MIDEEQMKRIVMETVQARMNDYQRQIQNDEVWIDALVRQTEAMERIAASLEKLAGCVAVTKDGTMWVRVEDGRP